MKQSFNQAAKTLFASLSLIAVCLWQAPAQAQSFRGTPGSVTINAGEITYYPSEHTTLSEIALQFTNNANNWQAIAKRNQISNDKAVGIGSAIVIPTELLPEEASQASVVALAGEVIEIKKNGSEASVAVGSILLEGSQLRTGKNGFVTFALPDNSRVSIPSNSQVSIAKLRKSKFTQSPRTEIKLVQGKVESKVTPMSSNKGRFEVTSPLAIAGVRGTHFRVGVNDNGIGNEVLEGGVAVGQKEKPNALTLPAGQGNIIDKVGVGKAIPLLVAPSLTENYQLQERPVLQFNIQAIEHAVQYRAQITQDAAAQNVLAEAFSKEPHFKFDGFQDGDYFIRVTVFDSNNLEGMPSTLAFKMKARPEPPFLLEPNRKVRAETVDFKWAQTLDAKTYRLQVASDAQFQHIVLDRQAIKDAEFSASQLAYGNYFWRVATVAETRQQADQGPYSSAQSFSLLAQQTMNAFNDSGDDKLNFSWPSEPGQSFLVELAEAADFKKLYLSQTTSQANLTIPRPEAGIYFIRVRATDADGFVGQFTKPQKFEIFLRWTTGYGEPVQSSGGAVRPQ